MPHRPLPPPDRLDRDARDYPLSQARLIVGAVTSPLRTPTPVARWEALLTAHGPRLASIYLREACELDHHPDPLEVVRRAGLTGYCPEE